MEISRLLQLTGLQLRTFGVFLIQNCKNQKNELITSEE